MFTGEPDREGDADGDKGAGDTLYRYAYELGYVKTGLNACA